LLVLAVGVLVSTGIAQLGLCCSLAELSRPVATELRDCCDRPDCCRSEKRGPAPAALLSKVEEAKSTAVLPVVHVPALGSIAAASLLDPVHLRLYERDHPPPPDGRGIYLRVSLLRV
jgi:hypothetical protein